MSCVKISARGLIALLGALALCCRQQPKQPDVAQLLADLASSDSEKSGKASLAIVSLGELAVPGLIEMLASPDPKLRVRAATTLWGLGSSARAAVTPLARALADADVEVRRSAAMALGSIGVDAAPAVPALITALKDSDYAVRQQAAKALGAIGPAAKAALPALAEAARHEGIRPSVEEARRRIQGTK
jgi:HEAT repeat protein